MAASSSWESTSSSPESDCREGDREVYRPRASAGFGSETPPWLKRGRLTASRAVEVTLLLLVVVVGGAPPTVVVATAGVRFVGREVCRVRLLGTGADV